MTVFIQIDEKTAITSDSMSWMISSPKIRKNKKTGEREVKWEPRSFFTTLGMTIRALKMQRLRESDASSPQELLERAVEINEELDQKLKPILKEV